MTHATWHLVLGIAALSACVIGAEPSHKGKTLSEWVKLLDQKKVPHSVPGNIAEMGEPATTPLIKAMNTHPDGAIRWLCHVAIAKIGRPAVAALDRLMQEGQPGGRIQAVLALEKILGPEGIARLHAAVKDSDASVRARAHGALIRLGEPVEPHLEALAQIARGSNTSAAWIAVEAIGQCGSRATGAEKLLMEIAVQHGGGVAQRAVRALTETGSELGKQSAAALKLRTFLDDVLPQDADLGILLPGPARERLVARLRNFIKERSNDIIKRAYAVRLLDQIVPTPKRVPATFHVAQKHPSATDNGPGTAARPWKTIQKAAETLRPGDTVLIHDGLYREFVRPFHGGKSPELRITYRAAPEHHPVITGADTWKPAWKAEGDGIWSTPYERHAWDYPDKWPTPKSGAMHRAEQIIVDGTLLRHVETREKLAESALTFMTDDEAHRLWIHPDGNRPPSESVVERSVRQQCFAPAVRGLGHIHVAGLTMRYAAAPESNGANWRVIAHRSMLSVRGGHHWLIEDNVIEWGNAQGMDIGGEGWSADLSGLPVVSDEHGGHVVRRNRVNHHGVAGIVGWGGGQIGLLLEDNETSYNCRKGNLYQYEAAGVKLHIAVDCVIRRHRAHRNEAFGIWLDHRCVRNRVSQCILTENRAAGFFFEVSAGPLLVDTNVILGTRNAPRGAWGEGIYSHDGNHAFYINNYIADSENYGIRIRNLFARRAGGKPTTTSHNRVWNNIIANCAVGTTSFNPDVPRAEDNAANANLIWNAGAPPVFDLDPGGAGIDWADHPAGKALGATGRGRLRAGLQQWQQATGNDTTSLSVVPAMLGLADLGAEEILQRLTSAWGDAQPALTEAYAEPQMRTVGDLLGRFDPAWSTAEFARDIRLSPTGVLQVWKRADGVHVVHVRGGAVARSEPLHDAALLSTPQPTPTLPKPMAEIRLASGDRATVRLRPDTQLLHTGVDATCEGDVLTIHAPANTAPGEYGVVLGTKSGWSRLAVRLTAPFELTSVTPVRTPHSGLRVGIRNGRNEPVEAVLRATWEGGQAEGALRLKANSPNQADVQLPFVDATPVALSVELPGVTLRARQVVAFPTVPRTNSWDNATWHPIHSFPGGIFPEGAEAFVLYKGILAADWAARQDTEGIAFRIRVKDMKHLQTKADDQLWEQDSLQLLLHTADGDSVELDAALRSDTGDLRVFLRESAAEAPKPVVSAVQEDNRFTYDVSVPWSALGFAGSPNSGTPLRLAILVNNDNGQGRHGIQWFFGIHSHRHDFDRMGWLWLE